MALDWSSPTVKLDNGYLALVLDLARPSIISLRVDPTGAGRYSSNQLAVSLVPVPGRTYPASGGLTQYVDATGTLHSSTQASGARVLDADRIPTTGQLAGANPYSAIRSLTIGDVAYGAKRETWRLTLAEDAPKLAWIVDEEWLDDAAITDCRTPVFWFSQRDDWGEPFHFQFLRNDLITSDPYDNAAATLVSGGAGISRSVVPDAGSWIVAKTYARVDSDLRIEGTDHLQRAVVLNWWSYLGQSRLGSAGATAHPRAGEHRRLALRVELSPRAATGSVLELESPRPEGDLARSLFATHTNCAMIANTRDGYLGNEPDGYHATMVSWMHARTLLFATEAAATAPTAAWSVLGLLRAQLQNIAAATDPDGVIGSGYAAATALDTNASFALSLADWATVTGDQDEARRLLPAVRRALDGALARAETTGGLLSVPPDRLTGDDRSVQPDHVIDYWDWLRRAGAVAYPNILLFDALQRHASLERWLGGPGEAARRTAQAGSLRERILDVLWDDGRGCLAESALDGVQSNHRYTAVQYLAIASGLLDDDRRAQVMSALDRDRDAVRRRGALASPTNLDDASAMMPPFPSPADEVVAFGHTMNGGSLLSWSYFEIAALVASGRAEEGWRRLQTVLERYRATALLEGVNYWDERGRPDRARLEPFLSDVGLVSTAIPRWFLGLAPTLEGIDLDPQLPAGAGDWSIAFLHLGAPLTITISAWSPGERRLRVDRGASTASIRLLDRGVPLADELVWLDGTVVSTDSRGILPSA